MTLLSATRLPICSMSRLNLVPFHTHMYETHSHDIEQTKTSNISSTVTQEEEKSEHSENQLNDPITHIDFEDVSMSFLSLSLK